MMVGGGGDGGDDGGGVGGWGVMVGVVGVGVRVARVVGQPPPLVPGAFKECSLLGYHYSLSCNSYHPILQIKLRPREPE